MNVRRNYQNVKGLVQHILVQNVGQGDVGITEDIPSQWVYILEWSPG